MIPKISPIYWDKPLNFWTGCTAVSPGCYNCWARTAHQNRYNAFVHKGAKLPAMYGTHFSRLQFFDRKLYGTIPGGEPKTYFVNNTSDTFHPDVPITKLYQMWRRMAEREQHRFLILTKRPERVVEVLSDMAFSEMFHRAENVYYGITAENQQWLEKRYRECYPACPDWLSLEPLLGPIDLSGILEASGPLKRERALKWVVIGAESGANDVRRSCNLDWVYPIVDQCQNHNIKVFIKQLTLHDSCVHSWKDPEWPEDLKIREKPWEENNGS